jgi:hypothetical protein
LLSLVWTDALKDVTGKTTGKTKKGVMKPFLHGVKENMVQDEELSATIWIGSVARVVNMTVMTLLINV